MKAISQMNRKSLLILGLFAFLAFGATADPHWGPGFGYHKKHHYVYYPKQNFYYDPFLGTYIVEERGVWVRQVEPPALFARININILPHVDLFVASYHPYYYNDDHCHTYRLATVITPRTEFYLYKYPYRYDFSITPYYFYQPVYRGPELYAYYDPNYYYHPGPKHGHHGHGYGHWPYNEPPGHWKKDPFMYPGHPGYEMKGGGSHGHGGHDDHGDHYDYGQKGHHASQPFEGHNSHEKESKQHWNNNPFPNSSPGSHGKQQSDKHKGNPFPSSAPGNHGKQQQPDKHQGNPFPNNSPGNHGKQQKPNKHNDAPQMNENHGSSNGKTNSQPARVAKQNNFPQSQGNHGNERPSEPSQPHGDGGSHGKHNK